MSYISSIATLPAPNAYSGPELLSFLDKFISDEQALRKLKFLWRESGILTKHSVLEDFAQTENPRLFNGSNNKPTTSKRLDVFDEHAPLLGATVAEKALNQANIESEKVDAIISVSCTGMAAPGLEIQLSKKLGLKDSTSRHAINFMGCYAAFHAMRLADMLIKTGKKNVLIVCVELCSLHFRDVHSDDNLLSTTLFSDGAAAMVVSANKSNARAQLIDFHSVLVSEGQSDMAWYIGDSGFEMVLNKHVPKRIEKNIKQAFEASVKNQGLPSSEVNGFAIHPGGKNVLRAFSRALEVPEEQLQSSFKVLENYGNMSSCSILFVLDDLLNQANLNYCYAAAFGPGLSVESALIKPCNNA